MKEKLNFSRTVVRCVGLLGLFVLWVPMAITYSGGYGDITRIDDPNNTPLWRSPGMPIGSSVGYIDNRAGIADQIQFYDDHADGSLKAMGIGHKVDGQDDVRLRFEIVDRNDRYVPDEIYVSQNGMVYVADDTWFVLKDSPVAIELQHRYEEVRKTYVTYDLAGSNFPENIPPEPLVEDEKKINRLYALLSEYQEQNKKCAQQTSRKKSEIHAWQAALAFYQLKCCYQQLNEREKTTVVSCMAKQKKLPYGMKIDSGPELIGIGDVSLLQGTDRDNFEFFLKHSYAETDYMSAWSIAEGNQMEEISKKYTKILKEKNIYRECE